MIKYIIPSPSFLSVSLDDGTVRSALVELDGFTIMVAGTGCIVLGSIVEVAPFSTLGTGGTGERGRC